MGFIEQTLKYNVIDKLYNMKFLDPLTPDLEIRQYFDDIVTEIENKFREMTIYWALLNWVETTTVSSSSPI